MQVPPISRLPLRIVTFIGAQFGRTLSRSEGTAPRATQSLYVVPIIVVALIAPFCVHKHGEKFNSRFPGNVQIPWRFPSNGIACLI